MKKKVLFTTMISSLLLTNSLAYADEISNLKEKANQNQQALNGLESKKQAIHSQMVSVQDQLTAITTKLKELDANIIKTQQKLLQLQQSIQKKEVEIQESEKKLNEKQKILNRTLRYLYAKGQTSNWEYLFSSNNFSQLVSRFNDVVDISQANKTLYTEVKEQTETLKNQKQELEAQKAEQEKQKLQLNSLKSQQESAKKKQDELLAELKKQDEEVSHEIQEQEAAMNVINNQIGEIVRQREIARQQQAALLKKQQEEQAKAKAKAQSSTSSSTPTPSTPSPTPSPSKTLAVSSSDLIGSGFSSPMKPGTYFVSSNFGWRIHPVTGVKKLHGGIDLAASVGTPIYAADAGTVLYAGPASGFGHWVVIDHNNGYLTVYGHMYANGIYVKPGQQVSKGQQIAVSGADGISSGAHLHFELHRGSLGNKLNPANYIGF